VSMAKVKPPTKAQITDEMLAHLKVHLAKDVWSKMTTSVVREVLSCLADWAYSDRLNVQSAAIEPERPKSGRESPEEHSSFLDALREIR